MIPYHALLEELSADVCQFKQTQLAVARVVMVRKNVGKSYVGTEEDWIALRRSRWLARVQEVQARLEQVTRANRRQLTDAERARAVVVVVLEDVRVADVGTEEDRIALRRSWWLTRIKERQARGEKIARADRRKLRNINLTVACIVMV